MISSEGRKLVINLQRSTERIVPIGLQMVRAGNPSITHNRLARRIAAMSLWIIATPTYIGAREAETTRS